MAANNRNDIGRIVDVEKVGIGLNFRKQAKGMGISLGTIRISVGLENCDDIIEDLEEQLKGI